MTDNHEALRKEARANIAKDRFQPEIMGIDPTGKPLHNIARAALLRGDWDKSPMVEAEFKRLLGLLEEVER